MKTGTSFFESLFFFSHKTVKKPSCFPCFSRYPYSTMKVRRQREGRWMDEWSVTLNIASLVVLVYFIGSCWIES